MVRGEGGERGSGGAKATVCPPVVVVEVAVGVHLLRPSLGLAGGQLLLGNPQQVGVLGGLHAEVDGVLEHVLGQGLGG